jgi:uncharacterized membrane protein
LDPTTYDAWKLVSLSPLPPWALAALGVAVLAGVVLAGLGLAREPLRRRKLSLWTLRVLAGIAALFFLLEPGVRNMQVAQTKNRVAVLVDRSASMNFPVEEGGRTRSEVVAAYLDQVASHFEALSDRFTFELYGFDPELAPTDPDRLRKEPARSGRTDLLSAIRSARAGEQGATARKLSGILMFSDGADNADLASGVVGAARTTLGELGVPVSTFLVGQDGLRDLSIDRVKVDDFAFVRNSITVEVQVGGRGFSGQTVPVVLSRENQTVANKTVTLRSAADVQTVSFTFTPDQTGRFVYTVAVPVYPGEAVRENNTASFVLKVIRDRIRVLQVVGRPSWDERFLRGLLKGDPNVDLVSFYILRTSNEDANVLDPNRELSLIPFPMEQIFDEKLHTFDVVIFQNFGYVDRTLNLQQYEDNLERYVHQGGAFAMLGGDLAFGEGRVTFPTLMKAMPVEPSGIRPSEERFSARLTVEGARHPVTAIAQGTTETHGAAWARLPAIPGANLTRARQGATVLLDHPLQTVDGQSAPILALWDYGRGRSLALTTDASWFWAFPLHAQGSAERYYDRFWSNALRWLVRDPALTTLRVVADPPQVEPGRPIAAIVTARLPDYAPAPDAEVKVDLYSMEEGQVVGSQVGTTGPDGVVRLEFPPAKAGAYKLQAAARRGGQELGEGEDAVAVRAVGPELSDASVRGELLEQIARVTGGRAYKLPQSGLPNVPLLDPPVVEVGRSRDEPLWDRWYYLLALAVLLGGEWFLRRRFGYV